MRQKTFVIVVLLLVVFFALIATQSFTAEAPTHGILPRFQEDESRVGQAKIQADIAELPLSFIANAGQADANVRFMVKAGKQTIFFTPQEVVFAASEGGGDEGARSSVVRLRFAGANGEVKVEEEKPLPGVANFFLGNDPEKWRANVPTYAAITYHDLYPGIDLTYSSEQGRLKSEFVVAEGADPTAITMKYSGTSSMYVREDGALVLETPIGNLIEDPPLIYQMIDEERVTVDGGYCLLGGGNVAFTLGDYLPTEPLIIDPTLVYSTYLSGSGNDSGYGIAVDNAGNAYVTGETWSDDFPTQAPIQPAFGGGNYDAFVAKIDASGSALIYSTYLGGSDYDGGYSIAVDNAGNAYVTGETSSHDFPTQAPLQPAFGGYQDAFVAKIDASGSLVYSTYLGGSDYDGGYSIAVDNAGNAYVTGVAGSGNFPTQAPLQPAFGGASDIFVTKINASGSALIYSTCLGGSSHERGHSIAVDNAGNAYVTGETSSHDFPTQAPLQPAFGGYQDAFVAKTDPSGSALIYSTCLGGSEQDWGYGIAVDNVGNAYVTGETSSHDFPTQAPIQSAFGSGNYDAFVAKIGASGSLVYFTCLGGSSGGSASYGIAVDNAGNAYVTGETWSDDFPTQAPIQPAFGGGNYDAFVAKIDASGSALIYSTYLGGSDRDQGLSIAVDNAGNAYVTGETSSHDFPTQAPLQPAFGGWSHDAFVAKIGTPASETEYWAVIVGATREDNQDPPGPNFSDDDALDIYRSLLASPIWESDHIYLALGSKAVDVPYAHLATKENIKNAIKERQWMPTDMDKDDVFLFFFSGHGGYIQDLDIGYLRAYADTIDSIYDWELAGWLDDLPTNNIAVVLEACLSGSFLDDLHVAAKGRVILTSTDKDHACASHDAFENSDFAFFIIQGLWGPADVYGDTDGSISVEELYQFAEQRAAVHPQKSDNHNGEFEIFERPPASAIQKQIDEANPGDMVYVPSGIYHEHVIVDKPLSLIGDNTIIDGYDAFGGIFVAADNVHIEGFRLLNSHYGIYLDFVGNCELHENTVLHNTTGIYLLSSHNSSIGSNDVSYNSNGVFLKESENNEISNNVASHNSGRTVYGTNGICLRYSNSNKVINNTVSDNEGPLQRGNLWYNNGIILVGSDYNELVSNAVSNNGEYNIYLDSSNMNLIYHNNLSEENEIDQAFDDTGTNSWDNGYPSGGNYWDDFDGPDDYHGENQDIPGGDGIVDTPYTDIVGLADANDRYPLTHPYSGELVVFADPNLEQAIREAIDKPTGDIYSSDLVGLTELYASERGISNLTGLEHCTNLEYLDLGGNQISDISALAMLTKLQVAVLWDNQIVDITPLSGLTSLLGLALNTNQISDIASLSTLTNLVILWLDHNQISDRTPLSGLSHLGDEPVGPPAIQMLLQGLEKQRTSDQENDDPCDFPDLGLSNNLVSDIQPLVDNTGIGTEDVVNLRENFLDLTPGSQDRQNIEALQGRGTTVCYEPQRLTPAVFRVKSSTGNVYSDGAYYGQSFETGSADVAEWVPVSEPVEPGDVLELDPTSPGQYRKARGPCSTLVAGAIHTEPGVVLGASDNAEGRALLALLGIVSVKVTNEAGPIRPGDLLVTSSTPGYAMRWDPGDGSPCDLVGKALEPLTEESGIILALLTSH